MIPDSRGTSVGSPMEVVQRSEDGVHLGVVFSVGRLLALLRAHELHEPTCPVFQRDQVHKMATVYLRPVECDCWLREEGT